MFHGQITAGKRVLFLWIALVIILAGCGEQTAQAEKNSETRIIKTSHDPNFADDQSSLVQEKQPEAEATPEQQVTIFDYRIVKTYPHDRLAFTQGLFFQDGHLYESTGLNGQSSLRKVALETGEVLLQQDIDEAYFGEGSVGWKETIITLTWRAGKAFLFGLEDFSPRGSFAYSGEGWGLTHNDQYLIMSDGTSQLRFLDPETYKPVRSVNVTLRGKQIRHINELEWVEGKIYANLWQTDWIAIIAPSGYITGIIDLKGLLSGEDRRQAQAYAHSPDVVLNGIAYDQATKRLFVTGKNWPKLYQIEIFPRSN